MMYKLQEDINQNVKLKEERYDKIGGVLIILAIIMLYGVVKNIGVITASVNNISITLKDNLISTEVRNFQIFEELCNILLSLFYIYVVYIFSIRKKTFVKWRIILYVVNILVLLADNVMYMSILNMSVDNNTIGVNALWASIGNILISAAIWIPYLLKSKRVKYTFVN